MGAWDCRGKTVHWIAALAQYYLTDCVEQAEPKHRQSGTIYLNQNSVAAAK